MSAPAGSVVISFNLNGQERTIAIDKPKPVDINQVAEDARNSNTSFGYSGRHDHGNLPTLKSGGQIAELLAAMQEAKAESDAILTAEIDRFYGYGNEKNPENSIEEDNKS